MKLFKIKIEHESYKIAENKQKALEQFWDGVDGTELLDDFINNITVVSKIDEAEELQEVQ